MIFHLLGDSTEIPVVTCTGRTPFQDFASFCAFDAFTGDTIKPKEAGGKLRTGTRS